MGEGNKQPDAPTLLREAAEKIDAALALLDTNADKCSGCGGRRFRNFAHANVARNFNETANKLRDGAAKLQASADDNRPAHTHSR